MVYRTYLDSMFQRFHFLATWMPNQHLELGDVGTIRKGAFERVTSLDNLRIPFSSVTGPTPMDLEHSSGDSVQVDFHAGADFPPVPGGPPLANARVETFTRGDEAEVEPVSLGDLLEG